MNKHIALLGRILLSGVFIIHGIIKIVNFESIWHALQFKGFPMAPIVLIIVIFIELIGGIAVLIGFQAKFFSPIMALYLFVITIVNYPFWSDFMFFEEFIRNMAIVGGLLILEYAGAGQESVDGSHFFDT